MPDFNDGDDGETTATDNDVLSRLQLEAERLLTDTLVCCPPTKWTGDGMREQFGTARDSHTEEELRAVKRSSAMESIRALMETAATQKGPFGARTARDLAINFFRSSGTILRLRVGELERRREIQSNNKTPLDHVPAVLPSRIVLWDRPHITFGGRSDGRDSMECVNRDELVGVATKFYQTGIRCIWFEKMLIEALVCAEVYATIKHMKTTPSFLTQSPSILKTLVCTFAFSKSRGGNPSYQFFSTLGDAAIVAAKFVLWTFLFWMAYVDFNKPDSGVMPLLWLSILGLYGLNATGKWTVHRIASWAKPNPTFASLIEDHRFMRAFSSLAAVHKEVISPCMSTTVVRDLVRRAFAKHAFVDHAVTAYLDRAIAAGEYLWS